MNRPLALVLLVITLAGGVALLPGLLLPGVDFEGADDRASEAAEALAPGFGPWVNLPPTGPATEEAEAFRFLIQGVAGAAVFLFCALLLTRRGRSAFGARYGASGQEREGAAPSSPPPRP